MMAWKIWFMTVIWGIYSSVCMWENIEEKIQRIVLSDSTFDYQVEDYKLF